MVSRELKIILEVCFNFSQTALVEKCERKDCILKIQICVTQEALSFQKTPSF